LIIIPGGIAGFMLIEQMSFLDAVWLTFITLTTIGYGDVSAVTPAGQIFTIVLILFGLSALASTLQATFALFFSPDMNDIRQRYRIQKTISKLDNHYIICGMGEMVDKTVGYLLQGADIRRQLHDEETLEKMNGILSRVSKLSRKAKKDSWIKWRLRRFLLWGSNLFSNEGSLLDVVVVITRDEEYAAHLRQAGLLVVEGDPTSGDILRQAGIKQAQALMVMLDNDTETLMSVLTAHNLNITLPITAAVIDEELGRKMVRVGATNIIPPFNVAAQFLNNATLRPAVNDFFNGILFDFATDYSIIQLRIFENSPWAGATIASLQLRATYDAGIVAIHQQDGRFHYTPPADYVLQEDEVIIAIVPMNNLQTIEGACRGEDHFMKPAMQTWQSLTFAHTPPASDNTFSLVEAEDAIEDMSQHFIICGSDRVAKSALQTLDPSRPFVVISNDNLMTNNLLKRGFKVVHGNPTHEETLLKAGVKRAQAIMVAVTNNADSVLSIITCRTLNKSLLITATANNDDMVDKLERAGADRVVSPFHIAARFVMLSTTRPEIRYFMDYVLYNAHTGLETAELYMEDSSPWIGRSIKSLNLDVHYEAGIIGVRQADKQHYIYAPEPDYVIKEHEVLIVVTPMKNSDELRDAAHGNVHKRPKTLRRTRVLQTDQWTRDMIKELINQKS
ncbi:MAG: potassium channel family protein, partial [Aggregatilineales bacterium]